MPALLGFALPVVLHRPSAAFGIVLAVPLGLALLFQIRRTMLLLRAQRELGRSGKRGILVYSQSPHWQNYVETNWLPSLAPMLVVLDHSEARTWNRKDVAVQLFRTFVGETYQYNPAVLVLRGAGTPLVFRFYQAFRDARHGKPDALRELEEQMFRSLQVTPAPDLTRS